MLTRKEFSFGKDKIWLKNSFCLKKDETLDLKGIYGIEGRALKKCNAGSVANTEDVKMFDRYAFSQTKLPGRKLPDEYGVRMIGTMLVAKGLWNKPGVFTTDEFDPDPYMDALNKYGLPWVVDENPVLVD